MHIDDALRARKSIRAFRPDPIPLDLVNEILETASLAPSGTNVQPWKVHVVTGEARRRLVAEVLAHRETGPDDSGSEFPRLSKRKEPFLSRMRKLGKDMYSLLGIPKGDESANWRQWGRNYMFFDAPIGLIFSVDKDLGYMGFVDIGIYMQTLMLVAKSRGLDSCAQGAWNNYWTVTRRVLNIPEDEYIVCGMSLGYADETAPVNTLVSEREPLSSFAAFHGFE